MKKKTAKEQASAPTEVSAINQKIMKAAGTKAAEQKSK
jgi:hypothetical protein